MVGSLISRAAWVAICVAILSFSLAACGGGHAGSELLAGAEQRAAGASPVYLPGEQLLPSSASGGDVQGVIKGAAQLYELPQDWSMGDLPGTVPVAPLKDLPHQSQAKALSNKQISAIDTGFATPGPHTLTASGQYPSP
jgi:hypothetical protein